MSDYTQHTRLVISARLTSGILSTSHYLDPKGVINKVCTLRFSNFRPPLPHVCGHTLYATSSSPLVREFGYYFFKEDMTGIYFVN